MNCSHNEINCVQGENNQEISFKNKWKSLNNGYWVLQICSEWTILMGMHIATDEGSYQAQEKMQIIKGASDWFYIYIHTSSELN